MRKGVCESINEHGHKYGMLQETLPRGMNGILRIQYSNILVMCGSKRGLLHHTVFNDSQHSPGFTFPEVIITLFACSDCSSFPYPGLHAQFQWIHPGLPWLPCLFRIILLECCYHCLSDRWWGSPGWHNFLLLLYHIRNTSSLTETPLHHPLWSVSSYML